MERVKQFYQVTLLNEEYMLTAADFHEFQKECSEIAQFGNPALVTIDKEGIAFKPFSGDVMMQIKSGAKLEDPTRCTHCLHQDQDTTEFGRIADEPDQLIELDQEIISDNRDFLLTKSPHKAIQAEAQQGQILSLDVDVIVDKMVAPIDKARNQIDVMVVKDKVETMEAPKKSGRPSKIAKDLKPLKKDAAVPPLDPEMDQIRKLAADKYGLAWTDAKRIWCLGSDLTKQEVTAVLPWVYPDTVWGFYRECHKGVEA